MIGFLIVAIFALAVTLFVLVGAAWWVIALAVVIALLVVAVVSLLVVLERSNRWPGW